VCGVTETKSRQRGKKQKGKIRPSEHFVRRLGLVGRLVTVRNESEQSGDQVVVVKVSSVGAWPKSLSHFSGPNFTVSTGFISHKKVNEQLHGRGS